MCGIAGILNLDGKPLSQESVAILTGIVRRIAYRGPDDEQLLRDGPLGMAFRRLSIVDLAGGSQPMANEDDTVWLAVNGEIYNHLDLRPELERNHRFRSRSDSEVLLHLYEDRGLEFLEPLNGMFALALWDGRRRRLILARDRLGIKPLYYHHGNGRLLFGSEIKALLAHPECPRKLDWESALAYYDLQYRDLSDRRPSSFFKGVEYLPGGHLLVADLDGGRVDVKPYWSLTSLSDEEYEADRRTPQQIVEGYRALLDDAVHKRLMADVELGVFLSGGLDSTAVTLLAAKHQSFHTFTVLSQSALANGDAPSAHRAAAELGLDNHQVRFDWHDLPLQPDDWKRCLWLTETPLANAEQLYKYQLHRFVRQCRPYLKVILLGQGSDEFNGGYSDFWLRHYPEEQRNWETFLDTYAGRPERLSLQDRSGYQRFNRWEFRRRDGLPPRALLRQDYLAGLAGLGACPHPWFYIARTSSYTLQMYNNWHEDRTAAGNSIENRVPFLDHRLVEYMMAIPPRYHRELFWDKQILRRAFAGELPDELLERPKIGFLYGVDERYTHRMMYRLLIADDRRLVEEAFADNHRVIDKRMLHQLLDETAEDPEYAHMSGLLAIVNMGLLEQMAKTAPHVTDFAQTIEVPPEADLAEWEARQKAIQLDLSRRRTIDLDRPLVFAEGVALVRDEAPQYGGQRFYLSIDDNLRYVLEKEELGPWIEVLRRLDSRRTLRDILQEIAIDEDDIRKQLEEALDYEVVSFD